MSQPETLMPPVHPGEILREDFMKPLGSSSNELARYFKTNPEFWLNLQNFFDLDIERRSGAAVEIEGQVHPAAAQAS